LPGAVLFTSCVAVILSKAASGSVSARTWVAKAAEPEVRWARPREVRQRLGKSVTASSGRRNRGHAKASLSCIALKRWNFAFFSFRLICERIARERFFLSMWLVIKFSKLFSKLPNKLSAR